jgi:peroxiredoxin
VETCDQLVAAAGTSTQQLVGSAYNLKGLAIFNQAKADNDAKRFPDAEAAFRNALSASPGMHIAHYNLGIALLSHGDDAGGIAELNVYLEKDPNGRTAKDAHRMIENPRRARENFAPDFAFATADGGYVSLDDLKGKVVMLDFWGTWCPPCVASIGSLKRLQKKYANEPFVLISVSFHDTEPSWRKFIAEKEMTWPQYRDASGTMARAYDVTAFPSYFVIDHEGVVRYETRGNGVFTPANIEDAIGKALKKMRDAAAK